MKVLKLVLVSGPPGCGKSTLAKGLAEKFGFVWLDKDCIDEPFSPGKRGVHYTKKVEPKVLAGVLALARLNLSAGNSVLLDVPWTHIMLNSPEWVEAIRMSAKASGAALQVLECVISEDVLRERLRKRGLDRDQVKLSPEGWVRFKTADRLGEKNPLPHTIIDVEKPFEEAFEKAVAAVTSRC